jgi:hypothetical protein
MNFTPFNTSESIVATESQLKLHHRVRVAPVYDFVEQATQEGQCFSLPRGGYFVVAPEQCLLPRFVVELKLPERTTHAEAIKLSYTLNSVSSGIIWFDSEDDDAHQFCWYLRLPVRVRSPLFEWDEHNPELAVTDGERAAVSLANVRDHETTEVAISLLTSFPVHRGGQTEDWARKHVAEDRVWVLRRDARVIGAAIVNKQAGNYSTVTMVLDNSYQSKGLGLKFMKVIGADLVAKGRLAVVSMSDEVPASFRAAKGLGMKIKKQAYTAQIGSL